MDMGSKTYLANLPKLVHEGKVSPLAIDDAVRPILMTKLRLGLFEHPYVDTVHAEEVLKAADYRELERVTASRTAVLLRNESQLLPLKKTISSLAVIGPLADTQKALQGSWSFAAEPAEVVTVLQGIKGKLPASAHIEYVQGTEIKRESQTNETGTDAGIEKAVDAARRAEATVLVLGELDDMSGEAASRSSLTLPGQQEALIKAVVATGKPVVLVLINGRPLDITWASTHVPAILEAWYPGTQGGNAVADVLFGDANPGGKLPVTWPRGVGQIPIYYAHTLTHVPETSKDFVSRYWDGPSSPLYPFGYGLSYTTFGISNLNLSQTHVKIGGSLEASVVVENLGGRTGDEVVQLYIHQQAGSASRPVRLLQGFERIRLAPGEKKTVRFTLDKENLSFWSPTERQWVEEPEQFDVWIGDDSTAALHSEFKVDP